MRPHLDDVVVVGHVFRADGLQEGPGVLVALHLDQHVAHEARQVGGDGGLDLAVQQQLEGRGLRRLLAPACLSDACRATQCIHTWMMDYGITSVAPAWGTTGS